MKAHVFVNDANVMSKPTSAKQTPTISLHLNSRRSHTKTYVRASKKTLSNPKPSARNGKTCKQTKYST